MDTEISVFTLPMIVLFLESISTSQALHLFYSSIVMKLSSKNFAVFSLVISELIRVLFYEYQVI